MIVKLTKTLAVRKMPFVRSTRAIIETNRERDMVRVILPHHLRTLANVGPELTLDVPSPVTVRAILDALEARHPVLCGTIREHVTHKRRPLVRFHVCEEDISLDSPDAPLPEGIEPRS